MKKFACLLSLLVTIGACGPVDGIETETKTSALSLQNIANPWSTSTPVNVYIGSSDATGVWRTWVMYLRKSDSACYGYNVDSDQFLSSHLIVNGSSGADGMTVIAVGATTVVTCSTGNVTMSPLAFDPNNPQSEPGSILMLGWADEDWMTCAGFGTGAGTPSCTAKGGDGNDRLKMVPAGSGATLDTFLEGNNGNDGLSGSYVARGQTAIDGDDGDDCVQNVGSQGFGMAGDAGYDSDWDNWTGVWGFATENHLSGAWCATF